MRHGDRTRGLLHKECERPWDLSTCSPFCAWSRNPCYVMGRLLQIAFIGRKMAGGDMIERHNPLLILMFFVFCTWRSSSDDASPSSRRKSVRERKVCIYKSLLKTGSYVLGWFLAGSLLGFSKRNGRSSLSNGVLFLSVAVGLRKVHFPEMHTCRVALCQVQSTLALPR